MSIIIQAGHVGIENNCDAALRGGTGAHGEREYTAQIAAMVCGALAAHGVKVIGADANVNCDELIASQDHEAFVALHCDARSASGFAVGVGNPSEDHAAEGSARLRACLRGAYSIATQLPDIDDLGSDLNETEYYAFRSLTPATPAALIELGAIADANGAIGPDAAYLAANKALVASGIVNAVLQFLARTAPAAPSAPSGLSLAYALTNMGQALEYTNQLRAVAPAEHQDTLSAIAAEIRTARGLLGGE